MCQVVCDTKCSENKGAKMCYKCANSTQGAYNEESINRPITNNLGSQSSSGSVDEKDLNNSQDMHFEGVKAGLSENAGIGQRGFGS
jgi:hypothetical protein